MRKLVCLCVIISACLFGGEDQVKWITIGADAVDAARLSLSKKGDAGLPVLGQQNGIAVTRLPESRIGDLSEVMHEKFNRCSGFIVHDSLEEAQAAMKLTKANRAQAAPFNYSINNAAAVNSLQGDLDDQNVVDTITHLSTAYHNRYYTTQSGVDAANWIHGLWSDYAASRSDATATLYNHSWQQPSVVLTITGTTYPDEIVVLGGHLDSVNLADRTGGLAPGADDNASGIAVLSEVMRVVLASGYQPARTVKFMGYAGEESGLLGSGDISDDFDAAGENVVGVLQLDMTNFNGSTPDIVLITDFTDSSQNTFIGDLIDAYVSGVTWATGTCGYACSDHASWTANGFAASMPFEAYLGQHNQDIHTPEDTLDKSGNNANHAMKFARLATAYVAELAKGGFSGGPGPSDPVIENFSGSLNKNQTALFGPFPVSEGSDFTATTTGSGDINLYVGMGTAPTTSSNDCASTSKKSDESCVVNVSTGVTQAYVLLEGKRRNNSYALTVSYTPPSASVAQTTTLDLRREPELFHRQSKRDLPLDDVLNLGASGNLQKRRVYNLKNGRVTRYQQQYQGVPVMGSDISVMVDQNGELQRMHGKLRYGLGDQLLQQSASLSTEDAMALAKSRDLSGQVDEGWHFSSQRSELVIHVDHLDKARLAYLVSYFADRGAGDARRPYFVIDALSGKTLQQWEGLTRAEVGTGPGGNGATGQYEYGTDFSFMDVTVNGSTYTMENSVVRTVDMAGTTGSTTTPYSYTGPRNTYQFTNGAFSPLNDAHYMGGVIVAMYQDLLGVNPLSSQLIMRVHYGVDTAFWNGTSMTFGDGGSSTYPMVVMDVAGHEVSHGYTEQNSDLVYSGQPGGINEAFSDIAGETAEFYNTGTQDWLLGAEIFKTGGAIRYMYNPPLDGKSIDHINNYTSGMDVHYSSGLYNKVFYLLANTGGWDTATAFQVFGRANLLYWNSTTDFSAGVCGVLDATTDLGLSTADVEAAFAAVGLSCGASQPTCAERGQPCNVNDDCCSNKCRTRQNKCR